MEKNPQKSSCWGFFNVSVLRLHWILACQSQFTTYICVADNFSKVAAKICNNAAFLGIGLQYFYGPLRKIRNIATTICRKNVCAGKQTRHTL